MSITQTLRVMKLTALFLTLFSLHVMAKLDAQTISFKGKDVSLAKVFEAIKQQTHYFVAYNARQVSTDQTVSVDVKDEPLVNFLNTILEGKGLKFSIQQKTIVISPKEEKKLKGSISPDLSLGLTPTPPPPADVTIVVTDADGKALQGASVTVKGNNKGLVTDINGHVTFKALDDNATLVISFTGYQDQEINVNKRRSIEVKLAASTSELDEMQVIAYGKVSKRFNVGNVATVKGEDIEKQPVTNVLQALEGRVPGLFITQTNGLSGGGITVRIQGQSSLNFGSDPLYVIDGVPVPSQLPTTGVDGVLGASGGQTSGISSGSGSPLSYLNPSDIESVEVLKDAAATSIYGSQAANGAILITTKKGKAGKANVSVNLQSGKSFVPRLGLLNTKQYLQMRREAMINDGQLPTSNPAAPTGYRYAPDLTIWDTSRFTDWQRVLLPGHAEYTNVNASVSGGSEEIQYLFGATYNKQGTVFLGDYSDKKASAHFSLGINSRNKKFNMQFSANYMTDANKLPTVDFTQYILLAPNAPAPYDDKGLNWALNSSGSSTWDNPYKFLTAKYQNTTNNLITNAVLTYHLMHGLDIKTSFGFNVMQTNDFTSSPLTITAPESINTTNPSSSRSALYGNRRLSSWLIEPQLTYRRTLFGGKLELLAGSTIRKTNAFTETVTGVGYSSDLLLESYAAATQVFAKNTASELRYNALYSRVNYRLKEEYIVELSARRDGSSRFGPDSRFHNFWSIAGGWIFSKENFFKKNVSFIDFGKIRASYGTTGSDQIGDYTYLNLYNPSVPPLPYQGIGALSPNSLVNLGLEWEETRKLSVGIDLGFFNDRLIIGAGYSQNKSSNQLRYDPISSVTGFTTIIENFPATIQNTSWEFSVRSTNIKTKYFTWRTSFNHTIARNKVLSYGGISTNLLGQPLSLITLTHFLGVDPQTGTYVVADRFGNATSKPVAADAIVYRNTYPLFDFGVSNSFSYKQFSLDLFFNFVQRYAPNNQFNTIGIPGVFSRTGGNILVSTFLSAWHKPGDLASFYKFTNSNQNLSPATTDAGFANAFFARMKNISLSWQMPTKLTSSLHIADCRVYVQGQNLLTLSNYKGLDPETTSLTSMPPLKTITVGLQVGF